MRQHDRQECFTRDSWWGGGSLLENGAAFGVGEALIGGRTTSKYEVARTLQSSGVSVFYDKFETVRLWDCRSGGCALHICSGIIPTEAGTQPQSRLTASKFTGHRGSMKCRVKRRRLVVALSLLILTAAWSACARTTDYMPPAELLSCFAKGTDILVSNGNDIPTMQIVTTKTFVMVSNRGLESPCEVAIAFMEEVKKQGGNAVIGFSFSTLSSVAGRVHSIVIYGTAVVVEPASPNNDSSCRQNS